ncbi:MAG: tRNA dihydrouridine(20/20a) synthase DusA [Steroidobacteraceae bacterium]
MENATRTGISIEKSSDSIDRKVSVAPMMDWTDRHCRYFLRQFSPSALLYTEMIHAAAIIRGHRAKLLQFSPEEQPLAIQLGGSDPAALAEAARIAADAGYIEVNLNCGCPSERVQAGSFGACLMLDGARVADCVSAMKRAVDVPVTVKLRVGVVLRAAGMKSVDLESAVESFDDSAWQSLQAFARGLVDAGADALIVHARKAVLGGWSPHENRSVPPLRFDVVERLRAELAGVPVVVNGGIRTCEQGIEGLTRFDGIMIGREAYHRPWLLAELEAARSGKPLEPIAAVSRVLHTMRDYAHRELSAGTRPHAITRHMLGLLSGRPGAKELRHLLSAEVQQGMDLDKVFNQAAKIATLAA